ncbi:MAG: hypothetical protein M1832_004021 [Thelocarpon impressellum]|nr:MAG: hypothetical protein M1832_004021 [Thelocarpon impressellum]
MAPPSEPTLRHATREDVPTILSLIHALAAYEHETASVLASEASLRETLSFPPFPSPGYARTLLLLPPRGEGQVKVEAAGFALYHTNYSTWRAAPGIYLEDLFVKPEHRGKGYGKALLRRLASEVRGIQGGRLEWSVLKWNEPSIKF